jgi:hypothetical protein
LCVGLCVFFGEAHAELPANSSQVQPQFSWQLLPARGAVVPVGLVGSRSSWWAALKELTTSETRLVGKNESAFGVVVQEITVDSVVVGAGSETLSLAFGNVLVTFDAPTAFTSHLTDSRSTILFIDPVRTIGVNAAVRAQDSSNSWWLVLQDYLAGTTHTIGVGDSAFGYVPTHLTQNAAVLVCVSRGVENSLTVDVRSDIPDLVAMTVLERDRWISHWRAALAALDPAEQRRARERMRDYWQERWQGSWGAVIAAIMSSSKQEQLRRTIASYWQ